MCLCIAWLSSTAVVCRGQHVALDFVRGVVHMHSRHIIHLDLKSANLLLARDGTAKIAEYTPSLCPNLHKSPAVAGQSKAEFLNGHIVFALT